MVVVRARKRILSAAWAIVVVVANGHLAQASTTVSICEETESVITHPATYVQEKVARHGVSCILLPHCCTPAWVLDPACYVLQWAQESDPWNEVVATFTCSDYSFSPEEAFAKWLQNFYEPVPGFHIFPSDVANVLGTYVSTAFAAASPIPDNAKSMLHYMVKHSKAPFSDGDIDGARYLLSNHPLAKPLWIDGPNAITYYNLIIVRADFFSADFCDPQVRVWAHEMVHVHQYNVLGWNTFLETYLVEGMKGYSNISYEAQAKAYEGRAVLSCVMRQSPVTVTPVELNEQAFAAQYKALMKTIDRHAARSAVKVTGDRITTLSAQGLAALKRNVPSLDVPIDSTRRAVVTKKSAPPPCLGPPRPKSSRSREDEETRNERPLSR